MSKKTKHAKHAARHRANQRSTTAGIALLSPDSAASVTIDETETTQHPPEKTSYEASPEVKRWLRIQTAERADIKPPFAPTFLAHQRDRFWVLSSLERFYEDDLIADVLSMVKSGKEATVYCCAGGSATEREYVAAKVYRPRMFRSLQNDALYRESRAQRDTEGRAVRNDRRWRAHQRSSRGQHERVATWISDEFLVQRWLYDAGADVPKPFAQIGNALLMDYIGEDDEAAPLLREVSLERGEARSLFEQVLRNIELFLRCDCIHGDLSAYNILYQSGAITIIDFAQAVDPRYNLEVYPLLLRDVERVCRYFARYGVEAEANRLASAMWERYLRGEW
ncbi:MAG TPA: RIO1 family regulatory kinase/ATPase [Ktedonobacterales bacterium]|nr:RIO1 family regulatory kinase/ATPase [Ktedonobacterales bacterium]